MTFSSPPPKSWNRTGHPLIDPYTPHLFVYRFPSCRTLYGSPLSLSHSHSYTCCLHFPARTSCCIEAFRNPVHVVNLKEERQHDQHCCTCQPAEFRQHHVKAKDVARKGEEFKECADLYKERYCTRLRGCGDCAQAREAKPTVMAVASKTDITDCRKTPPMIHASRPMSAPAIPATHRVLCAERLISERVDTGERPSECDLLRAR